MTPNHQYSRTPKDMIFPKKSIAVLALFSAFLFSSCSEPIDQKTKFTLGFIPSENALELSPKAEALAEFLEEKMGPKIDVEVVVPTEYEALIEGLHFGHIDASFMDSGPAWIAHQKTGAEVILAEVKDGNSFYYAEIFVKKENSNIKNLQDILQKRIAFTSWTGSSGFIMPIGKMINEGLVNPISQDFISLEQALKEAFDEYTISGGYQQSLNLLLQDQVDVIAGPHDLAERFLEPNDRNQIKSILRLGKVPSHSIVIRPDLPESLVENFTEAMRALNRPENLHFLRNIYGVDGLNLATTEEHLGEFGPQLDALTGIHGKVLQKKD